MLVFAWFSTSERSRIVSWSVSARRASAEDRVRVESFVVRARRVLGHSLALDVLCGTYNRFGLRGNDLILTVPDEERVESLVARLRPFFMSTDDTHFPKVLHSLGHLAGSEKIRSPLSFHAEGTSARILTVLSAGYASVVRTRPVPLYTIQIRNMRTSTGADLSSAQIAHAYMYGQVFHSEMAKAGRIRNLSPEEWVQALVTEMQAQVRLTVCALAGVRYMQERGFIRLRSGINSEDVTARRTRILAGARVYTAAVGTPVPGLDEVSFGPGWEQLEV